MPLCGFNQKMLEGLIAFHEGLIEHGLVERSGIKGQPIEGILEKEITDMERFLKETDKIADPEIREITEALTKYAKAFYNLVKREGVSNHKQIIKSLNNLYAKMDNKFYSELEGKPEDMKQLAEYINEIEV